MPRKKNKKDEKHFDIDITKASFQILSSGNGGMCHLEYRKYKEKEDRDIATTVVVKLPVISCWMDDAEDKCVKAHMQAPTKMILHKAQRWQFFRDLRHTGPVTYRDGMVFTADSSGIIRFGAQNINSHYSRENRRRAYHDSKGVLLKNIMQSVSTAHILVGGIDLIDLYNISDDVLEAIGFVQCKDLLGRMPPMWIGDINEVFESGPDGYSWKNKRTNMESFLKLVETSLGKVA